MSFGRRRRFGLRLLSLLSLGVFVLAGPGVEGLEVGYHLTHGKATGHGPGPHFEQAGPTPHDDHCQVGLSSTDHRLPACTDIRIPVSYIQGAATAAAPADQPPFTQRRTPPARAPPVLL
jgi:hypothetical protein